MTDDYTPGTEAVRYAYGWTGNDSHIIENREERRAEFDRWFAAESARLRAEGAAEALRIAADFIRGRIEVGEFSQITTAPLYLYESADEYTRQSITPVPEETRTVLMTEPHNGHEPSALCPGCPHEAVPEEGRTNNVFPNDCLY